MDRLEEIRQRAEQLVRIANNPYCLGPAALLDGVKEIVPALLSEVDRLNALHKREIIVTGEYAQRVIDLTARAEAAEAERDACKADLKSMADWYRDSVCDDGICGWCKQDADHGLDGDANECAGFYKNDCFEWRGPQAGKGGPK